MTKESQRVVWGALLKVAGDKGCLSAGAVPEPAVVYSQCPTASSANLKLQIQVFKQTRDGGTSAELTVAVIPHASAEIQACLIMGTMPDPTKGS